MRTPYSMLIAAGLLALPATAFAAPADRPGEPATRAELQKRLTDQFTRLDANKDNVISGDERRIAMEHRRDDMFKRVDADGDGKISEAEFAAMHEMRRGGERGMRGKERREARRDAMVSRTETRDQFMARRIAMFDRIDTNKDGTISAAEREAARSMMRARLRDRGEPGMRPPPAPAI